jgi:predicted DNA binding CopG/RHH family protein
MKTMGRTQLFDSSINLRCNESDIERWKKAAKSMEKDLSTFIRETLDMVSTTPKMLDLGKLIIPDEVPDEAFFDLSEVSNIETRVKELKILAEADKQQWEYMQAHGLIEGKKISKKEYKVLRFLAEEKAEGLFPTFDYIRDSLMLKGRSLSAVLLNLRKKCLVKVNDMFRPTTYEINIEGV